MPTNSEVVFSTPRLQIRVARAGDANLFCQLWNDPRVMGKVGFPDGLGLSLAQVVRKLERSALGSVFQSNLVVQRAADGAKLGECYLGLAQDGQTAETDVKLLPEFWGQGYGLEIKQGLLDYLFTHSTCETVQATPNVDNPASIRMQEAVGGQRVGEGVANTPSSAGTETVPVHYYIYQVSRQTWETRRQGQVENR